MKKFALRTHKLKITVSPLRARRATEGRGFSPAATRTLSLGALAPEAKLSNFVRKPASSQNAATSGCNENAKGKS